MATINGKEVTQVKYNGNTVNVLVIDNRVSWVKSNTEQSFTVYGTTGTVKGTSPSGLSLYPVSLSLYVGTDIKKVSISGDNSCSINTSTGVVGYTLYGVKSNMQVSATLTLEKVTRVQHTVEVVLRSANTGSIGKYAIKGSKYIGFNALDVTVTASSQISDLVWQYDETDGYVEISGYTFKRYTEYTFTITYYTEE